jgi:hypothetical protein
VLIKYRKTNTIIELAIEYKLNNVARPDEAVRTGIRTGITHLFIKTIFSNSKKEGFGLQSSKYETTTMQNR